MQYTVYKGQPMGAEIDRVRYKRAKHVLYPSTAAFCQNGEQLANCASQYCVCVCVSIAFRFTVQCCVSGAIEFDEWSVWITDCGYRDWEIFRCAVWSVWNSLVINDCTRNGQTNAPIDITILRKFRTGWISITGCAGWFCHTHTHTSHKYVCKAYCRVHVLSVVYSFNIEYLLFKKMYMCMRLSVFPSSATLWWSLFE